MFLLASDLKRFSAISSTFGLKVSSNAYTVNDSSNIRDVGSELLRESEGEASKIFIPIHVNGYRVVGHLDSGSDVSIMQFSLYKNLQKSLNYRIDEISDSTVKNLTSFSGDNIPVKGEIFVNLKFSASSPSSRFRILVIKDIGVTPPLLLGDDLLKQHLGSISYDVNTLGKTFPTVHFKKPKNERVPTFYEKLSLINIVSSQIVLNPFEKKG